MSILEQPRLPSCSTALSVNVAGDAYSGLDMGLNPFLGMVAEVFHLDPALEPLSRGRGIQRQKCSAGSLSARGMHAAGHPPPLAFVRTFRGSRAKPFGAKATHEPMCSHLNNGPKTTHRASGHLLGKGRGGREGAGKTTPQSPTTATSMQPIELVRRWARQFNLGDPLPHPQVDRG